MVLQLLSDSLGLIFTVLIGLTTLYLARFYIRVYQLPRGPFPYPFIGNLLLFRNTNENQFVTISKLSKKYGKIFTVWLGRSPMVFVADLELIKEAFNSKNNEFMGRPKISLRTLITQNKGYDIVFSDHGPVWASLRRLGHAATRKLGASDKLLYLVNESVEKTVSLIKASHGENTPFDIVSFIYLMIYNVIASSIFGKSYDLEDPEFNFLKDSFEYFRHNTSTLLLVDQLPIAKPLYYRTFKKASETVSGLSNMITRKYREHLKDYQKGVIRDFCDGLIEAKEEAIAEEKESAPHFTDNNLALVIVNLFVAGTDTSNYMMRWIILFMANNIDMQKKMREEVERVIGDRMPTHEDKLSCIYVQAFICECLRYRPVAPLGVLHRAMCDANIGDYQIPENTLVSPLIWNIQHDTKYWQNPEKFDPQRFISADGTAVNSRHTAFIPFGIGRRICLGEKLALEDLFLITVRLLQSTSNYLIVLPGGDGSANLAPDPDIVFLNSPTPYKIMFQTK